MPTLRNAVPAAPAGDLEVPTPLLTNVQCAPAPVARAQLVDFLRTQKRNHPGYRVIDVGGAAGSFPAELVSAVLDVQDPPAGNRREWYRGNIDDPRGWREVEAVVAERGRFDFAICSHTLEDICSPSLVCDRLGRVARMGYVAVPSKYKELARFEAPLPGYRGYIHHRWIFTVRDGRFWGFPKLGFLEQDLYFDRFAAPELARNDQLSFWWKNALELQLVNDGYLGPSPAHVMDYYRIGLSGDDLDRKTMHSIGTPTATRNHAGDAPEAGTVLAEGLFGRHLSTMEGCVQAGGSELGLGISLFSLAVSINAQRVIEIGRFKGFSTFCLASALRYLDRDRSIPAAHRQRPDINYDEFEAPKRRVLISIDPCPTQDAYDLIAREDLTPYLIWVNRGSEAVSVEGLADLIFIDGDHTYEGCKRDVEAYVPRNLKPGGYFILHDYFGWYDDRGRNCSPIKAVIDELAADGRYEHLLVDTGYMSFSIFRKPMG
jgi:predicted O-methyltransferase YrrM